MNEQAIVERDRLQAELASARQQVAAAVVSKEHVNFFCGKKPLLMR